MICKLNERIFLNSIFDSTGHPHQVRLCSAHDRELFQHGQRSFLRKYNIDLKQFKPPEDELDFESMNFNS